MSIHSTIYFLNMKNLYLNCENTDRYTGGMVLLYQTKENSLLLSIKTLFIEWRLVIVILYLISLITTAEPLLELVFKVLNWIIDWS